MRIDLDCPGCGGNDFRLDEAKTDQSVITCAECGRAVGTLATFKDRVERALNDSR